jgi:hypothetical protein
MSASTDESQSNITISDQPAGKDSLGLTPYVIAMTEFLTHPDTKPPLTISIEGEWGSGKSSFMEQLEEQIKVKSKEVRKQELQKVRKNLKIDSDLSEIWKFLQLRFGQETQTVWFNAWRHEKAADLLQALNMMISNDPQIIFILGMDREKVAAGITYKQKNVLPYLASIRGKNQDSTESGVDYEIIRNVSTIIGRTERRTKTRRKRRRSSRRSSRRSARRRNKRTSCNGGKYFTSKVWRS